MPAEKKDIKSGILDLIEVFPEEAKRAEEAYKKKIMLFKNAQK